MANRPEIVTTADSPWIGYLTAVYGRRPVLPFVLRELNFFYHHDEHWPSDVEWPMAPCMSTRTPMADTSMRRCNSSQCSRWSAADGGGGSSNSVHGSYAHVIFPNGGRSRIRTKGTAIFERWQTKNGSSLDAPGLAQSAGAHSANSLLGHRVGPNGSWVEVMRMSPPSAQRNGLLKTQQSRGAETEQPACLLALLCHSIPHPKRTRLM